MRRSNIESHTRSKDENRSVAGRMREGRLRNGEPANVPQTGQGNSFREAVCSTQSTVQKVGEREENRDLIASLYLPLVMSSGVEASLTVQSGRGWQGGDTAAGRHRSFTRFFAANRQVASRPCAVLLGQYPLPTRGN